MPNSENGYDHSEEPKQDKPAVGDTTERQPSWRPGARPAGGGIYSEESPSAGTEEKHEMRSGVAD